MTIEVVRVVSANNLVDGGGKGNKAVVGRGGGVSPLAEKKDFCLQPTLRDTQAHDPFDQKKETTLEGLREHRDQI